LLGLYAAACLRAGARPIAMVLWRRADAKARHNARPRVVNAARLRNRPPCPRIRRERWISNDLQAVTRNGRSFPSYRRRTTPRFVSLASRTSGTACCWRRQN